MGRRRIRLVTGLSLVVLFALPMSAASAHAVFVSATPPPNATLRAPPASVRMVFSEPLDAALSGIAVYSSTGRRVQPRRAGAVPGDPRAFEIGLPSLGPDRYTVVWHTVSAIDGHSRRGSYSFTVDRPDGSAPAVGSATAPPARGPPTVPTWVQAAVLWLGLAGLFWLTGSVLAVLLGAGTGVSGLARTRRWLLLAGAGCLVAGTLGQMVAAWAATGWGGASLGSLLSSSAGRWWAVRLGAVAIVLAGERLPATPYGGRARRLVGAAAVGVTALTFAATGHGAASPLSALGLAYAFVHVLAASVWLGGAVAVAAVWTPARRSGRGDRGTFLRRYSIVAGVAVPALLASGLGNAVLELGTVEDLVTTAYGLSLLAKLVLVLVLTGVAGVNATVLRPAWASGRPRGHRLARTITIEAVLGLAVLVPTAVLGVLAPSRPTDQARAIAAAIAAQNDPAHAYTGSTRLQGRAVEVTVTPGAVGVNAVRVEVDGNFPVPALRLSLTGPGRPLRTDLPRTGHDHDPTTHTIYQGSLQLARPGAWRAGLVASGGSGVGAMVVLPVTAAVAGPSAGAQPAELARWLGLIALAGLGVAVAAAARAVPAHRRRAGALALGATGMAAAVAWAGTLALGPASPAAGSARWGSARTVAPTSLAGAQVWRIPTPGAGLMIPAVAPDGSVWVAEMDTNELARLDPRTSLVQEFRFPGAYRETMGVAVAADERVWVAQEHAMALGMFDPTTGRYREFPIPGRDSAPVGIAVGRDGQVWFTEMSGNAIASFDPSTGAFATYPVPTPDAAPYWLALAPDGRVWFTEFATGKLGVLDPRTGRIHEYALPGRPNVPGIAVGPDGTVWSASTQGTLFGLTPSSRQIRRIRLPAAGDYGVAVAPDGTVWIGRQGGAALYALDPASGRVEAHRLPAASAPWWPVLDGQGHVWVALASDDGNGLARLDRRP